MAEQMIEVTYPLSGRVPELRGRKFTVPSAVVDKAAYLEEAFAEEMAQEEAKQARARREQKVLNDRIDKQVAAGRSLPTERLDAVEQELKALRRAQVGIPSTMDLQGISNQILTSHNSLYNGQQFLQSAASTLEKQAQELAANTELTEAQRQQALEFQRQAV